MVTYDSILFFKIPPFSSNINGSLIPDTGNQLKLSGFANKSNNNSVPTKNEGNEYKINNIKDIPLSTLNLS